jgi:ferredoxin
MEGNGPGSGDPKLVGLICASERAVAMDRVVTDILGARPNDVPILRYAKEAGVEGAEPVKIEVVGEEPRNVRIEGFRFPPLESASFTANLPGFIDTRVRRALTTRPHVANKTCTLCGACVEVCPAGVMEKSKKISIDYDRCIRCYCCQEICPERAISVRGGWLKRVFDSRFWQTHLRRRDVV